jgi:hypothetical protein
MHTAARSNPGNAKEETVADRFSDGLACCSLFKHSVAIAESTLVLFKSLSLDCIWDIIRFALSPLSKYFTTSLKTFGLINQDRRDDKQMMVNSWVEVSSQAKKVFYKIVD